MYSRIKNVMREVPRGTLLWLPATSNVTWDEGLIKDCYSIWEDELDLERMVHL